MNTVLEARALQRRYGTVPALRELSLTLQPGEIYGLVGPDGAGKTTALRLLAGLIAPTAGTVRVAGRDPLHDPEVREVLGYMPQQYSLYGDLTVDENLQFFATMSCLEDRTYRARRERLLAITRLERFTGRRADALSGGMYKKLALSCVLLHEPQVLLLDEPTNGVDPVSRRDFWDLLGDFVHEGMAVLLATPYMDEAERCHRVGLVHAGRMLLEGEPPVLLRDFPHGVFRVEGGERAQVHEALQGHAGVLALSPAGRQLRVVVDRAAQADVVALAQRLDALLEPVRPDFEDLFLARMEEAQD